MVITSVFNFKGMITDQHGHEQKLALLENFKYILGAPYSLVAIEKYLLKRRTVEGNKPWVLNYLKEVKV